MSFLTSQSIEKKLSARQILLGAAFQPDFSKLRRYLLSICACDTGRNGERCKFCTRMTSAVVWFLKSVCSLDDLFRHDEIHFRDKLEKFCANPRDVEQKVVRECRMRVQCLNFCLDVRNHVEELLH